MSEHGDSHPDESGKNRAYLSVAVIVVAMAIAMGVGQAAPTPRHPAAPGKTGVMVLDAPAGTEAEVVYGTIVERGVAWKVISPSGVRLIPKARVREGALQTETDRLGDAYYERYPVDAYPLKGLRYEPLRRVASVPRAAKPRLVSEAELAQTQAAWTKGTRLWAQAYARFGFQQSHFENLRTCASRWFDRAARSPESLRKHVDGLEDAIRGVSHRPEVRRLLANSLSDAAIIASAEGVPDAAIGYATRLRGLGGEFTQLGQQLLDRVKGVPPEESGAAPAAAEGDDEPVIVIEEEPADAHGAHGHD